jgi:hypothetical protein
MHDIPELVLEAEAKLSEKRDREIMTNAAVE